MKTLVWPVAVLSRAAVGMEIPMGIGGGYGDDLPSPQTHGDSMKILINLQ